MGQIKKNNNKELTDKLKSPDLRTARAAMSRIRKEGTPEDIPGIIEALGLQEREDIRSEIQTLLCDIRIAGSQQYIINGIKQAENEVVLAELLSVCWESQLDYSAYLEVFISCFLNSDYRASLEAFTIIEGIFLDYDMPEDKLKMTQEILKSSYADLPADKRELSLLLIESLEGFGSL
jgi:hypothetical protein